MVFAPAVRSRPLLASSPEHDGRSESGSEASHLGHAASDPRDDINCIVRAEVEEAERPSGGRLSG